jgi:hypothetical protein
MEKAGWSRVMVLYKYMYSIKYQLQNPIGYETENLITGKI